MKVRRASVLIPVVLMLIVGTGCPGRGTVSSKGGSSGKASPKEATAEDILKSAIHQLRPENFSIDAAQDKPISLLNSWRVLAAGARKESAEDKSHAPMLPTGWASAEEEKRLAQDSYDERDALHIRDCLLTHAIANNLATRSNDELGRAQAVFDFVVRNIALRADGEPELPLGTYLLLLVGRGSAEDRVWICASILKQLRIDTVIVQSATDAESDPDAWLMGVVLNNRVHLFDPRLGIAIPSTAEIGQAATPPAALDEIADHPEWLQSLAPRPDQPYVLEAEALKQPLVMPVVEVGYWGRRMNVLEQVLPAEDFCVLYDPPVNDLGRTGVAERIAVACNWIKPEGMKAWPYPHRQLAAIRKMDQAQMQQISQALIGFNAPIPFDVDRATGKPTAGTPERKMLRIRTDQLLGKYEDATQRYLSIRHLEIEGNPFPDLMAIHRLAAEDAIYWSGLCKFESQEYASAIEQLGGYIKRFDRKGRWSFAARALLAECRARLGQFAEAVSTIERTLPDDPFREANAIQIKRWTASLAKAKVD